MANIATVITKIRTAVKGQDVRAGIADAMEAVNADNIEILNTLENVDLPAAQAAAAIAQNAAVTATQKSTQATGQADRAATAANLAIAAEENVSQYLETMSEQAVAATTAATTATQKSTQAVSAAETAVNNARQAETFAGDALASATAAATAAGQISEAAGLATAKAAEALQSANTAETKATDATTAANTVLAALENLPEGNVTPEEKAAWNAKQNAIGFTPENVASKGLANGYAALDAAGKVPLAQLPEIGSGTGDMLKSIYDTDNSGTVDNAEKVNGLTVETAVPADAAFTDTIYTHPESHPAAMIIQDSTHRFVTDTEKALWTSGSSGIKAYPPVKDLVITVGIISHNRPVLSLKWIKNFDGEVPYGAVAFASTSNIMEASYEHCLAYATQLDYSLNSAWYDDFTYPAIVYFRVFQTFVGDIIGEGLGSMFIVNNDVLMPSVENFNVQFASSGNPLALSWTNPDKWDFEKVIIKWKVGYPNVPPQNPEDWITIYEGVGSSYSKEPPHQSGTPNTFRISAQSKGGNWNTDESKSLRVINIP